MVATTASDGYAIEAGLEIAFAAQADHLICHLTLMKKQESWNRTDTILRGQLPVLIHVHFADLDLSVVLRGEFIQNRSDHFAGAAPLRPEIYQHGSGGLQHFGCKVLLRQSNNIRS